MSDVCLHRDLRVLIAAIFSGSQKDLSHDEANNLKILGQDWGQHVWKNLEQLETLFILLVNRQV